jgi:hypothetical protein
MMQKYISEQSFQVPKVFVPTSAYGHAPFFFWLFNVLSPKCTVELGSANGYTFFVFCQASSSNGSSVYAIDTWRGDINTGSYGEEIYQTVCYNLNKHFPKVDAHLLRSTFHEAASGFSDASIDLIFIDGCHTYDAVKADYETWRPKMSHRGVMVFHDTAVIAENFGVQKFWNEITMDIHGLEFKHDHGLGILPVGSDVPEIIKGLVREDDKTKKSLQAAYAYLGERLTLQSQLAECNLKNFKKEARINSMLNSFSWRLTAPLRLGLDFIKMKKNV